MLLSKGDSGDSGPSAFVSHSLGQSCSKGFKHLHSPGSGLDFGTGFLIFNFAGKVSFLGNNRATAAASMTESLAGAIGAGQESRSSSPAKHRLVVGLQMLLAGELCKDVRDTQDAFTWKMRRIIEPKPVDPSGHPDEGTSFRPGQR